MKYVNFRTFVRPCLLAGLAFLMACTPNIAAEQDRESSVQKSDEEGGEASSLEEQRRIAWENFDREACEAKGGEARQEGMLGMPRCNIPYADAGEICADASDCEGLCIGGDSVTDYEAPPGEAKGVCQANDSPFGCYARINDGVVEPMMCVD